MNFKSNTHDEILRPLVGVGVLIMNNERKILLGLRKAAHGSGEWAFPGGHLEFGETIFETAAREVKEETGLTIEAFELVSVSEELRYLTTDNKHYVTMGVLGIYLGGEVRVMEPEKCLEWKWFSIDDLPDDLFEATANILRNVKDRKMYQSNQKT